MKKAKRSALRKRQEHGTALEQILGTPNLEQVVPRMQPELLPRVIQSRGLEDCGEIVMLATPQQLTQIFDLDLWRSGQPGMEEQFDADRFGIWLEVLAEFGAGMASQKIAEMDADLVIAGLAQHVRVFDCAVVTPYRTTDGGQSTGIRALDHGLACDVGGYRLVATRTDSWEAIVLILISLDAEHNDYFHRVMRGCRALSNAGREPDVQDLVDEKHQVIFDLALDRERRQDEKGYVPPAQARAFLEMSRALRLGSDTMPPANPIARAYLRSLESTAAAHTPAQPLQKPEEPALKEAVQATVSLVQALREAGIIAQQPRALLNGSQNQTSDLSHIRTRMQFVFDCDNNAYARRSEELMYIANTIMAGCGLQGRSFTTQEAWDAAAATCNLGLENWPSQWIRAKALPNDFLVHHDLVTVFQVGWTMLHREVSMYTAQQLLEVLGRFQCEDCSVQAELDELRIQLSSCYRTGMPWRARNALDVIAILDMAAWTALLGLIDECPVLHAALRASQTPRTRSVSASAFEFISENSQIAFIREFMQSLPDTLSQ